MKDRATNKNAITVAEEQTADAPQSDPHTITLDTPIKRGNTEIKEITLRKPSAGELRGTSLSALVNLEYDALQRVLPRVTTPTLSELDVKNLDPADLVQLGGLFVSFLLPKALQVNTEYQNV